MALQIGQRTYGTSRNGLGFTDEAKVAVWTRARVIPGLNPAQWRLDACGARMFWADYGKVVERGYGWEIDHMLPVAHNGTDDLSNLQALQWQNNRSKGDTLGQYKCAVVYQG